MHDFYSNIIKIRREKKAWSEGSFAVVSAEGYTVCLARFTEDEVIFTAASMGDRESYVYIPREMFALSQTAQPCVLSGEKISFSESGVFTLPAHSHSVFSFSIEK